MSTPFADFEQLFPASKYPMNEPENQASPASSTSGGASTSVRTIPSEELLRGERQVVILHHGEAYRLLVTRNDKLLLQK